MARVARSATSSLYHCLCSLRILSRHTHHNSSNSTMAAFAQSKLSLNSRCPAAFVARNRDATAARSQERLVQVRAAHPGFPQQEAAGGEQEDVSVPGAVAVDRNFGDEFFADDLRPVILFDGSCNLCNGGVQFVLDFDKDGVFRFASLQSDAGKALLQRCGRAAEDISSIVLVSKERHWVQSQAVLHISKGLQAPFPLLQSILQPIPGFIRDSFYELVANNRYSLFGEANSCRMMLPEWRDRFLV